MSPSLQQSWEMTRADLERARNLIPSSKDESDLAQYVEFLEANELELALDELEAIGSETACPPEFWRVLLSAAEGMHLTEHVTRLALALRHSEIAV